MSHFTVLPSRHRIRTSGADGARPVPSSVELESVVRVFGHGASATRAHGMTVRSMNRTIS